MSIDQLKDIVSKLKTIDKFISSKVDDIIEENPVPFQAKVLEAIEIGNDDEAQPIRYRKPRKGATNASGKYSLAYSRYKTKLGGKTNVVDLNLTGEFTQSIQLVKVEKNHFVFTSNDDKAVFIEANYGDVLGIQEVPLQDVVNKNVAPELERELNNYLK